MKITDRINGIIHPLMLKYLRHQYAKKLKDYEKRNPELFKMTISSEAKNAHIKTWGRLIGSVNTGWLKVFSAISGRVDPRFVPEDVFYGVIERCFNNCNASGSFVEDKNDICFYVPKEFLPDTLVRYERGVWFDAEFNPLTKLKARSLLYGCCDTLVGKPTMFSSGGSNVKAWNADEIDLDYIESKFEGYVFQCKLVQDAQVSSFNPSSVNTCRIITFRRPWSGDVSVIAGILRMGSGEGITDNLSRGGVCVDIDANGRLADFGVDHEFGRYAYHPLTKIPFKDFILPGYHDMCVVACEIAKKVPGFNLLGFDMIVRDNGRPCIIEINATSMAMARLQTVRPLFGEETEQVVDWCVAHRRFDSFNHLRTWY